MEKFYKEKIKEETYNRMILSSGSRTIDNKAVKFAIEVAIQKTAKAIFDEELFFKKFTKTTVERALYQYYKDKSSHAWDLITAEDMEKGKLIVKQMFIELKKKWCVDAVAKQSTSEL